MHNLETQTTDTRTDFERYEDGDMPSDFNDTVVEAINELVSKLNASFVTHTGRLATAEFIKSVVIDEVENWANVQG